MGRTLSAAVIAWSFAILAAVAALVVPGANQELTLALLGLAVAAGVMVAILLATHALGRRRHSTGRPATADGSLLSRLEYVPPVTTGTRRLRWRGSRYAVTGRRIHHPPERPEAVMVVGRVQPRPTGPDGVTESARPRPASSTRQPPSDEVEGAPRAS